ncbi:MAG: hypothetical protein AABX53_00610 [Nanoarchaeota archaeon]
MDQPVHEVRSLFLREFVKQLINNCPLTPESYVPSQEYLGEKTIPEPSKSASTPVTVASMQNKEYSPSAQSAERILLPKTEGYDDGPQKIVMIREIEEDPSRMQQHFAYRPPQNQQPIKKPQQSSPSIVDQWLSDATIEGVECTGPDQNLIIKRNGSITQSTAHLTQSEIQKLVESLSKQANVPLTEGVLKAETPQWTVIGIVSEFGGSRFLLQKKGISHRHS